MRSPGSWSLNKPDGWLAAEATLIIEAHRIRPAFERGAPEW